VPACLTAPPTLLVCAGKDCRGDRGFAELVALARACGGAATVPCQGLCHGPIVGLRVRGEVRWFSRVRSGRMRAAALRSAARGTPTKRLREHEVRSRRGVVRGEKRLVALSSRG